MRIYFKTLTWSAERIEADFMTFGLQDFLIVVDSISGFLKVCQIKNKTTSEAIGCGREWSSIYGAPYQLKVDNGPWYREHFFIGLK